MMPGPEGPTTAGSADDSSDETIELKLGSEQQLALSQAAEAAAVTTRDDESRPALSVRENKNFASRRTTRIDFVCNLTFAVVALGIAVGWLWPASYRHRPAPPPLPAITRAVSLPELAHAEPAAPRGASMQIRNAFDPAEVFEFPHGTTESEARAAVADLLLSRARERLAGRVVLRRTSNLQPDRGAAAPQPGALVLARARNTCHADCD